HVRALAGWDPAAEPDREIRFSPARVVMQDFTGVPAIVDLATMREAMRDLGGDAARINPLAPAELVIDHSVVADLFGTPDSFTRNVELEYERNYERYQFLRWGQGAFDDFKVVPPGTGIVHQVNIEYLARVVFTRDGAAYPDTLVGTDSHTTMVNGLGVLGWGVGGIEAEAAMLGQSVSMLIPKVVGFKLTGAIPSGVTATDVVLTITQQLRKHGVVGKFVEFYGDGVAQVPLPNRATIGNMSPEFGSTAAIFPIDDITLDYLRLTGRSEEQIALVEAYSKMQTLWRDPNSEPIFSEYVELDLSTVVASIAGPKRPQDRVALTRAKEQFEIDLENYATVDLSKVDAAVEGTFPASDPIGLTPQDEETAHEFSHSSADSKFASPRPSNHSNPAEVTLLDGSTFTIDHGIVGLAALTSCTNTSNPSVMIAAGLLARNASKKGLKSKPWVKTTLAPGSKVVTDYYAKVGLDKYLEDLGFYLVGYGCTTCIGNSGGLLTEEVSAAVHENDLAITAVLSGNRNFEGRINPDVKMNYLASPPLVVAYALAGSMDFDFATDSLGTGPDGEDVFLKDIWPDSIEVQKVVDEAIDTEMFKHQYSSVFDGDQHWKSLETPTGSIYDWNEKSTYIRKPPFFDGMTMELDPVEDISRARVLAKLGDSVTTDHISPAGNIKANSPAGMYLEAHGIDRKHFNSYGSRRGNHEVMIRGTFANIRLRNQLLDNVEGGYTRDFTQADAPQSFIYDASQNYQAAGIPLVVLAGKEYGSGSSRDWAAKGTALLGVHAVIAASYERIHRSNLIGMGVAPLQFLDGQNAETLGLDGTEYISITGLDALNDGPTPATVHVLAEPSENSPAGKKPVEFDVAVRIDTPGEADYYRHGGILQYVLRSLAA
ncbi:MAG TPA: aconitate hydratase, partial [Microbacteriaceae bacterium]